MRQGGKNLDKERPYILSFHLPKPDHPPVFTTSDTTNGPLGVACTPTLHDSPDCIDLKACGFGHDDIWALATPSLEVREEGDSAMRDCRRRQDLQRSMGGRGRSVNIYPTQIGDHRAGPTSRYTQELILLAALLSLGLLSSAPQ